MSDENVNTDIEESARKDKNSEEAAAVVQEMEKLSGVKNPTSYGWPTNKVIYSKKSW